MGMFDSVYVKCPQCDEKVEFQSKAGPCYCHDYTMENAPPAILGALNNSGVLCKCGFIVVIRSQVIAEVVAVTVDSLNEREKKEISAYQFFDANN